jgi:hypothetical protein
MFYSLNLRVVELWSLPDLDPVRLVFFFCCFVFDFVVVDANRKIPKLLLVGMADVGRYSCYICKPWLGVCRQELFFCGRRPLLVSVVTRRNCVVLSCVARGQHAPGSVLPGLTREGHSLLFQLCFVSIWSSGGRSMPGRVPGVGACSTRLELRSQFSWYWLFGFFCLSL